MQSHTQFARLSRQAMTSQHGQALQDSGFIKRDSHLMPYASSVLTTTSRRAASFYPYGTVTGRLSSGRPATQSIPRTGEPSTSLLQLREMLFMQRFGMSREQMREQFSQRISLAPSKLESLMLPLVMQSWALAFPCTPSHFSSLRVDRCIYGSTRTQPDLRHVIALGDSFDLSASSQYP